MIPQLLELDTEHLIEEALRRSDFFIPGNKPLDFQVVDISIFSPVSNGKIGSEVPVITVGDGLVFNGTGLSERPKGVS